MNVAGGEAHVNQTANNTPVKSTTVGRQPANIDKIALVIDGEGCDRPIAALGIGHRSLLAGWLPVRLIEISLPDAACNWYSRDGAERIETVANRYRVNIQKISEAVAGEFAARRQKSEQRRKHGATGKAAREGNGA